MTVMGVSQIAYIERLKTAGWRFVPAREHPAVPTADTKHKLIIWGGLVLMEIPLRVHSKMRRNDLDRAVAEVQRVVPLGDKVPSFQMRRAGRPKGS